MCRWCVSFGNGGVSYRGQSITGGFGVLGERQYQAKTAFNGEQAAVFGNGGLIGSIACEFALPLFQIGQQRRFCRRLCTLQTSQRFVCRRLCALQACQCLFCLLTGRFQRLCCTGDAGQSFFQLLYPGVSLRKPALQLLFSCGNFRPG